MDKIKDLLLSNDHDKISEAIILLQDCGDQYLWLRDYANARLLLPTGSKSWTQVYSEVMREGLTGPKICKQTDIRIETPEMMRKHPDIYTIGDTYLIVEKFAITIEELHRNVANEVLFFQTFMDYNKLRTAIREVDDLPFRTSHTQFDQFQRATVLLMNLIHGMNPR